MIKNIDSLTVLKGLLSLNVFFAHYLGFTRSFGISTLDSFFAIGSFGRIFINGNLAVCMFIVISSYLAAIKVEKSEIIWADLIIKRYLRLVIPCSVIAIISVLLLWGGCFVIMK